MKDQQLCLYPQIHKNPVRVAPKAPGKAEQSETSALVDIYTVVKRDLGTVQ